MNWIQTALVAGALAANSVLDMRRREVSVVVIVCMTAIGLIWRVLCRHMEWVDMLLGLVPGAIALVIALTARECIGFGDVWMLFGMGIVLGGEKMLVVCMSALFEAGFCALILVLVFHKGRKYELPFVPFLFLGYLWSLAGG